MANWVTTLKLTPEWLQAKDDELPPNEMAKVIAERLRVLPVPSAFIESRDELAEEFESLAVDEELEFDDFNYLMKELYDWADTRLDNNWPGKKLCWVETMI